MGIVMNLDAQILPDDPVELKKIIASMADNKQRDEQRIQYLEEYVRLLKNEIFGRKTEKRPLPDDKQMVLFNEAESDTAEQAEQNSSEDKTIVPAHSRRKRGRKPLPADLPRVEVIHDIDESEKTCPCGCQLKRIGEEVCEKLDYVPAKIQVERHIRYKYACPDCEGVEDDGPTVKIAPPPVQLLPKSMATSGLVAHIVTAKFEDALPLYRQEKIFTRIGIDLPRATMAGWMIKTAEKAGPLLHLLNQEIRSGPIVNIDETPVQVLNEPNRANTTKSYMWVFRGGDPDRPALVYHYHPTRAGQVPLEFLKGYQGYVQTDGYNGYEALGRQSGVDLVGCWAHARRMFDKVVKAKANKKKQGAADEALDYIGRLYAIEKEARKDQLDAEQLKAYRQLKANPILDEFKKWLDAKVSTTPPKGLLGKAIGYTLNLWPRLVRYIDDGRLRPDNNLAENAIRPFVVGRKNWLFSGHPKGAAASAALYSLIETAKANGLKPYFYLRYLFDQLPLCETEADYEKLLPRSIDPDTLCASAQ
jgi:transposase